LTPTPAVARSSQRMLSAQSPHALAHDGCEMRIGVAAESVRDERREPEVRTPRAASAVANFGFKAALES